MIKKYLINANPYIKWGIINFIIVLIVAVSYPGASMGRNSNEKAEFVPLLTAVDHNWSQILRASQAYDKISGQNYRSSAIAYRTLSKNVIPIYQQAIFDIQNVHCETKGAVQFQNTILNWLKNRLNIYTDLASLYQANNVNISGFNEQFVALDVSNAQRDKIFKSFLRLKEKYGIAAETGDVDHQATGKDDAKNNIQPSLGATGAMPSLFPNGTTQKRVAPNTDKIIKLEQKDIALAGLKLGSSMSEVKNILGKPINTEKDNEYVMKYTFPRGIEIYAGIKYDAVTKIIVTQNTVQTSRGLKVGDDMNKIPDSYGKATIISIQEDNLYQYFHKYNQVLDAEMSFYIDGKSNKILSIGVYIPQINDSRLKALYEANN